MGALVFRALQLWVYDGAPDFWKLPYKDLEPRRGEPTQTIMDH